MIYNNINTMPRGINTPVIKHNIPAISFQLIYVII
jgi:hypothetical protein